MKAIRSFLAGSPGGVKRLLIVLGVALIYLLPVLSIPGLAAIYLKIEGIDGEATEVFHKDWIEVQSWSWGVSRSISSPTGGTREASAPSVSEVVLSKVMDKASPKLFLEAAAGKVLPAVTVHVTRPGPNGEQTYYEYTLGDVLVSSYAVSSGGDKPFESFSFNFTKIELKYAPMKEDGSLDAPVEASYDFSANKGQ